MADLYLLTSNTLPPEFLGSHLGYSIKLLLQEEKIGIEDRLFAQGEEQRLGEKVTTIIIPNIVTSPDKTDEYLTLTKFALSMIVESGFPSFSIVAIFSKNHCVGAESLAEAVSPEIRFIKTINGVGIAQWLYVCSLARKNLNERMHITADRFVRYIRSTNTADALMDLCISLESLIDSQTEVSFRFGIMLAKVLGDKGKEAEANAELLSELYTLRSKIAHGDPQAIKLLQKVEPKLSTIRQLARRILTVYVLFMSNSSREEWKSHLRSSVFS
jgi:hypothetical protein